MRGVFDFKALGERTLWLDCDVLQADGGTRCAAISGAYVAARARARPLRALEGAARLGGGGVGRRSSAASRCSTSTTSEDSGAEVDLNVVMTGDDRLVEVQATAEREAFSRDELTALLDLAAGGIERDRARPGGGDRRPSRLAMRAALASRNEHKLRELEAALPGWELALLDADDYPPETGETYYENALRQGAARPGGRAGGAWVLGEDSGIEVEGLGGEPGVHSARWREGRRRGRALLERLDGIEGEAAARRYVCELVALAPDGERAARHAARSTAGSPTSRAASEGFGYDPIFVPDGESRTVAELGDAWKRAELAPRARRARPRRGAQASPATSSV